VLAGEGTMGVAERRIGRTALLEVGMRWQMYVVVRLWACAVVDLLHDSARVDGSLSEAVAYQQAMDARHRSLSVTIQGM
jgi:hypothetical protein